MQQMVGALGVRSVLYADLWRLEHGVAVEAGRQKMIGRHLISLVADLLRVPLVHHGLEALSLSSVDYLAWLWH